MDAYWRNEAFEYIRSNPASVATSIARKTLEFASHEEVANNRSLAEERLFSPVLRTLPSPFGWLFALGIPGLILLAWHDRRGWLIIAPLLVVIATFSVFFAEARFRFHAVPLLALGGGLLLDQLWGFMRAARHKSLAGTFAMVLIFAAVSAWATRQVPQTGISWDAIAWGYFKMGDLIAAEQVLETPHPGMDITDKWEEALGLLHWSQGNFEAAARHYRNATELNPVSHVAHYNLALALQRTGDINGARRHAALAVSIAGLPEYVALQKSLGQP
ncbi:MAG: tetratricopeptide repeat protein [Xanthomonadales bacterium]|nr:tetratricopeptide repeat protein [Xanthomonadales bacterium]